MNSQHPITNTQQKTDAFLGEGPRLVELTMASNNSEKDGKNFGDEVGEHQARHVHVSWDLPKCEGSQQVWEK